jgi:hypothetical protein
MTGKWLPIKYREFYDVPRAIVVAYGEKIYFFNCVFDSMLDEYSECYKVYGLRRDAVNTITAPAWVGLENRGVLIGELPVSKMKLDSTKRQLINVSVFGCIERC